MPYITNEDRDRIAEDGPLGLSEGELNYIITCIVDNWLEEQGVSYQSINAAVGVLECAKLELYSRVARVYEEQKRFDNGDVYTAQELM